jgi:hypothetical protein
MQAAYSAAFNREMAPEVGGPEGTRRSRGRAGEAGTRGPGRDRGEVRGGG